MKAKQKLKLEDIRIDWYGKNDGRTIRGYKLEDFLSIHRSVNSKGRWTVTHNRSGTVLIDKLRSRTVAMSCAAEFLRCVRAIRKKYLASI